MPKTLLLALLAVAPLAARAQDKIMPLNVKLGLWESSNTVTMNGAPPIPEDTLAKMTPEQRARFEEMMKRRGVGTGTPQTNVYKSCVTREKLDHAMAFDDKHNECIHTVISSSSTHFELKVHCQDPNNHMITDGNVNVDAISRESGKIVGHMVAVGSGGHAMNVDITGTSKYLGPDCGDVK
jgi:hypothetical protein